MIKADLNLRMIRFCMDYTQKRFCNMRAVGLYTGHGVAVDSFHQHRCRPRVQIPVLAVDNMVVDTNYQTGKTYGMGN